MRKDLLEILIYKAPNKELLNLANNENYYSDWNKVIEDQLKNIVLNTSLFQYGTSKHEQLVNNYASYMNVENEQVLVAPGSDGLIPLLINTLTDCTILTLETDFFRYNQAAQILKRKNISVPLIDNLSDKIIEVSNKENIEMILFSNPNNPLGIQHSKQDIIKILDNTSCYVVIDEAYAEYTTISMCDLIDKYDKLIVLRTMSKAWGLAGLRVGYALSNKNTINFLKAVQGPFTLSDLNGNIAAKVLEHQDILIKLVDDLIIVRNKFVNYLKTLPIEKVYDSHSNFVYIETNNSNEIHKYLIENNIAIAKFSNNGLRITIGTSEQMERVKVCLDTFFGK